MTRLANKLTVVAITGTAVIAPTGVASAASEPARVVFPSKLGQAGPFGSFELGNLYREDYAHLHNVSDCYEWYPAGPDTLAGGWFFTYASR